jgi:hypothetical protein
MNNNTNYKQIIRSISNFDLPDIKNIIYTINKNNNFYELNYLCDLYDISLIATKYSTYNKKYTELSKKIKNIIIKKYGYLTFERRYTNYNPHLYPIVYACYTENHDLLINLLKKNIHIDEVDEYQKTGLFGASDRHNYDFIELLLANGANINHQDESGCTVLHHKFDDPEHIFIYDIKFLLDRGIDKNIKNHENKTALDYALGYKDEDIIKLLKS